VCWYTADERERDIGLFVEYLIGAIDEQFPGFGEQTEATVASLSGGPAAGAVGVAEELANDILRLNTPLVLVLDNFESLVGTLGIRGLVRRLIEILPPNCHMMIGSRVLPDIPITHLVAKRQLVGLASHDLRFTAEEIRGLLAISQIEVSEAQAQAITANSEGWITGVLLLADLLRENVQVDVFSAGRATAETYGYLAAEVLDRQPPDLQHFLTTASALREMTVPLCREVLQIAEPEGLLAEIERRNLFVTRFGSGAGATFRYHNLFRGFLHRQLQERDPAAYNSIHLRAAAWFDQANDVEETVYHYLAAEDYAKATALMERVAGEWFVRGRVETLLRWGGEIPESAKPQAPRLLLYQARVLTDRYVFDGARQATDHAEAGFAARGARVADLAEIHNLRAVSELFQGHYEEAIVEAQMALEMVEDEDAIERVNAQRYIGKAYVGLGRPEEGVAILREALESYRRIGSPYAIVNSLQDIGAALGDMGHLDDAGICLSEALAIVRRLGASAPLAMALNNLGYLYHLRGEYYESLALFEEGLVVSRRAGDMKNQAYIALGMADVYRDVGAYERAEPLYRAARHLAQETEAGHAVYVLLAQADMRRWQGEPQEALALVREGRGIAEDEGLSLEAEGLSPVSEGIALAEGGEVESGIRAILDGLRSLERHRAKREMGRGFFLLAKAHLLAGDEERSVTALRQAMEIARECGSCQFAVAEGRHSRALIPLGVNESVAMCDHVAALVGALQSSEGQQLRFDVEGGKGAAPYLEIRALGEGQVIRDGQVLSSSDWRAAMAKELFFYILLNGPLERDAIGAVFWPEHTSRKMRNSFHTTLHRVRGAVGAQAVVVEDGLYRLGDVDYWFDVHEFEALVARARLLPPHDWQAEALWQRALALYEGDFLATAERLWCVPRREALREMYIEALIGVGRSHEARRDFDGAVEWYQKALAVDELREDVHRRIMQCYAESGRRSKALAQYTRCAEMLREQLGLEPAPETRQLYERIAGVESG
jgi:LuxR family maltose regulon positive regulatory protein